MRALWMCPVLFALATPAQAEPFSTSQRELGPVVLRELTIGEGKLVFRVDSGGCTDAGSFKVDVEKHEGAPAGMPHYSLTVRRTRKDECKAMLWDGVVIELDLEKDIGLRGTYTISVENPVALKPGAAS